MACSSGRFAGVFLALFSVSFGVAVFSAEDLIPWLVDSLSGTPVAAVVVLGWLPTGLALLLLMAAGLFNRHPRSALLGAQLAAPFGLLAAFELGIVFYRSHSRYSDAYLAAVATPAHGALYAGAWASLGGPVLWTLLFAAVRWVWNRLNGRDVSCTPILQDEGPRARTVFLVGFAASSLLALGVAIALLIGP